MVSAIPNLTQTVPAIVAKRYIQNHCVRPVEYRWIDIREAFIDWTFVPAKKRSLAFGKTKSGKDTKIMAIEDSDNSPVTAHVEGASTCEVGLVEEAIDIRFTQYVPD